MNEKLKTLEAILNGACLGDVDLSYYDLTIPDDMDESGAGGAWDLSGAIAQKLLTLLYNDESKNDRLLWHTQEQIQSLVYNFITEYKGDK